MTKQHKTIRFSCNVPANWVCEISLNSELFPTYVVLFSTYCKDLRFVCCCHDNNLELPWHPIGFFIAQAL